MLLSLSAGLDFSAYALSSSGSCGSNVTYTYTNSNGIGVLTISGTGEMKDYSSSSSTQSPFYNQTAITHVIIKDGVTKIGNCAFYGCSGLTSVTIPDSVTSIGSSAFSGCSGLTSVTIPDSVTSINDAFYNCTSLNEITMPCSAKIYNSQYTFYNCTNIEKVTLTKGTGTMQNYETSSSSSTTTYYQYTPWYLSRAKCKEVVLEDGVTSIGNYAFYDCSGLTSITIPDSVTSIGSCAFQNCTGLTSITIPDSVTSIGTYAFERCTGLTKVNISDIAKWCKISFINGYSANPLLYAKHLYLSNEEVMDLVIPDNVTSIGANAFYNCAGLTSITIPNSVKSIGQLTFSGCTGLTSVTIPNSVTSIGQYTFNGCTGLTSVTIPDSVTSISSFAFSGCTGLTSVTIPDSVKSIGYAAFKRCTGLTSITIPNSVTSISSFAFYGCTGLTSITIPNSVKSIGSSAFSNCGNISETYLYSKVIDSTQNLVASLPSGSTLYAYTSTDAQTYCDIYGVNFVSMEGLECQLGRHSYEATNTISPTCEDEGKTVYTCSGCGDSYEVSISALGHTEVIDKAVEPTCTEAGLTAGTHCSVCEKVLTTQEVIPANGHSYNDVVTAPTCKDGGYTTHTCTICGDSYIDSYTEKAESHSYTEKIVAPTCISKGFTLYTCTRCGDNFKTDFVNSTDEHDYKSAITTLPTCSAKGVRTYTCTVCGDKYTEDIAKLAHTVVTDEAVAPTCTETGLTEGTHCAVCGEVIDEQAVITANGHSYTETVVAPTCEEDGYTAHTCEVCDDSYNTDTVEALGHSRTSAVTKKATIGTNGTITNTCSTCGDKTYTTIPMIKTVALSATSYVYDGKAKKPGVTVKDGTGKVVPAANYTVAYKNNVNVGTGTVTVIFKGNYSGTKAISFTINPKGTAISKLKAGKKQFTANWTKQATQTNGYQIQYSMDKSFKSGVKTVNINSNATVKTTVKKLTSKKVYYVRIRTFRKIGNTYYYSAWSATKNIKVK